MSQVDDSNAMKTGRSISKKSLKPKLSSAARRSLKQRASLKKSLEESTPKFEAPDVASKLEESNSVLPSSNDSPSGVGPSGQEPVIPHVEEPVAPERTEQVAPVKAHEPEVDSGSNEATTFDSLKLSAPDTAEPEPSGTQSDHTAGKIEIPVESEKIYQNLKLRKKFRYITFTIDDWVVKVDKTGDPTRSIEDLLKDLPFAECRFAVIDFAKQKSDQYGDRMASKVFFITWLPNTAPTELKMLYSTQRKHAIQVFSGVEEFIANGPDDVLIETGAKPRYEDASGDEQGWLSD